MAAALLVLCILVCSFMICHPLTVLLHELGHAIPALIMTRNRVVMYIGSYGDQSVSIKLNLGPLQLWFTKNPFLWQKGLCRITESSFLSVKQQIIFIAAGPVISFVIAAISCYYAFTFDIHGLAKYIVLVFLVCGMIDLFFNLIPNDSPVILSDGSITYNDGYHLKGLLFDKKMPNAYSVAIALYEKQQYAEAAPKFHALLTAGLRKEVVYRLAMDCYLRDYNYVKAKELAEQYMHVLVMCDTDYFSIGLVYSRLEDNEQALLYYDKALILNPGSQYAVNNKAYIMNLLGKYEEAILLFNYAIEVDNTYAYSYNNRGLAKIKLGYTEEGLADIRHSLELDGTNAYAFRNLGIYHFDKGEYHEALILFKKTQVLDSTTHLIETLLKEAEEKVYDTGPKE